MFKLLTRIALLLLIAGGICLLFRSTATEFWCGPVIANKQKVYEESQEKYDVVFVGTSRINHGIDPLTFDKTYQKESGKKVKSFNFGISGATAGESYNVFDYLLERDKKPKYVVLELCSIFTALSKKFCKENLHTNRNKYWLDTESLGFAMGNVKGYQLTNHSTWDKIRFRFNYFVNFIENQLGIGMFDSILKYNLVGYPPNKGIGPQKDGYNNINQSSFDGVQASREGFLKRKHDVHLAKRNKSKKFFGDNPPADITMINEPYLNALRAMIQRAEANGVTLVILAPPLMAVESYEELSAVYWNLPNKNRLNLTNGAKHPNFYKLKNIWDGNHVNHDGAVLFSELLAKKMVNKFKKRN